MSLSTRALETKVKEWSRKRPGGDIGVEVELEGTLDQGTLSNRYWVVKPEGSLRDGCEYVLAKPVGIPELDDVGREFDGMMEKSKPKKTIRCSTHIHVNVNNRSVREVYNIIAYYYLVEELLVRTQGPARTGNLFCLRMSDAEDIGDQLVYSTEDSHLTFFNQNANKYGALNLAAPMKFGSLEFRFLLPMTSWKEISFWVHLLHRLVDKAKDISPKDSVKFVSEDTPREFLSRVFSKDQVDFILGHFGTTLAKELLLENYDYIEELSKALSKPEFFRLPQGQAPHDLNYLDGLKKTDGVTLVSGTTVPADWFVPDPVLNQQVFNWGTQLIQPAGAPMTPTTAIIDEINDIPMLGDFDPEPDEGDSGW